MVSRCVALVCVALRCVLLNFGAVIWGKFPQGNMNEQSGVQKCCSANYTSLWISSNSSQRARNVKDHYPPSTTHCALGRTTYGLAVLRILLDADSDDVSIDGSLSSRPALICHVFSNFLHLHQRARTISRRDTAVMDMAASESMGLNPNLRYDCKIHCLRCSRLSYEGTSLRMKAYS